MVTTKHVSTRKNHTSTLKFIDFQIKQLQELSRIGTAQNYRKVMHSFSTFLNGRDIPLHLVNKDLINHYNAFLQQRGMIRNSISFYMRNLRAIYNKAVGQGLVIQSNPFTGVYTGIDKTHKRAINESTIAALYQMDLSKHKNLAFTRDLFIFSYCARGMSFIDISFLKKKDIENGYINYTRRKTGQRLSIKIEPCMKRILERYIPECKTYVFPIITSTDRAIAYKQYQTAINKYNRMLHKLSKHLSSSIYLTSYVARHSWATAARNHNIPISIISTGMGHTSEETTKIYLQMLDNSIIDEANRTILKILNN